MGTTCSSCESKDETIKQLVNQGYVAHADIRVAQATAQKAAYALVEGQKATIRCLLRLDVARGEVRALNRALNGYVHEYLADVGRYGIGNCFEVARIALLSAIEHHPLTMAGYAATLATLWHVCFRAHVERLKRATALGQPLGELLENERFADVSVHSRDGPPIAAHACVLSTSPYFASLLQLQELAVGKRPSAEEPLTIRCDEEHADVRRYVEWLYLGVVNEQHAEQLFVLADRLTDVRLQLACSQQLVAVRADVSAWWQLVIVAGAAAAGVLVLSSRVR